MLILVVFVFRWRTWSCASVLTGCWVAGLGVVVCNQFWFPVCSPNSAVSRLFHPPRDVFTLLI